MTENHFVVKIKKINVTKIAKICDRKGNIWIGLSDPGIFVFMEMKTVILKRKLNNNAVLVEDEHRLECVLIGNGIAFNIKNGDLIDEKKIEKKFILEGNQSSNKILSLVKDIPANHLILVNKIVSEAEKNLDVSFEASVYMAIADHINYAITRAKKGIILKNAMTRDIKKLHPKVFQEAMKAIEEINYSEGVSFTEDEAAFIALHFLNAMIQGEDLEFIERFTIITSEIIGIVEEFFDITVDLDSFSYVRFETHIKFLVRRLMSGEAGIEASDSQFLFNQVSKNYPKAFHCALKVVAFIENKYQKKMNKDEMVYFIIHIQRIISR